jgi:hypothetical protein
MSEVSRLVRRTSVAAEFIDICVEDREIPIFLTDDMIDAIEPENPMSSFFATLLALWSETRVTANVPVRSTPRSLHELYIEVKGLSNDARMLDHSAECDLCGKQVDFDRVVHRPRVARSPKRENKAVRNPVVRVRGGVEAGKMPFQNAGYADAGDSDASPGVLVSSTSIFTVS